MIHLLTYALGGEGWLNFEGNEFDHPEWLDFPRAGNNDSFHYCRRLFYVLDEDTLRYKYLDALDQAMNAAEEEYNNEIRYRIFRKSINSCFSIDIQFLSRCHRGDKVLEFERGNQGLLWIFNFHTHKSFADYRIGCGRCGK